MKRNLLSVFIILIVSALTANAQQPVLTDFYTYTLNDAGTYGVSLNDNFKVELNKAKGGSFTDTNGYTWTTGNPLPNPAVNGEFNGIAVTDMNLMFKECDSMISIDLSNLYKNRMQI